MPTFGSVAGYVQAFRYWLDDRPDWFVEKVTSNDIITHETHCEISTSEGIIRGDVGDFIVQDPGGDIFPLKPYAFWHLFEQVWSEEDIRIAKAQAAEMYKSFTE